MESEERLDVLATTAEPIDIKFEQLCHFVKTNNRTKQLLKGVHGSFSGGHFTAILGASGAGKTTLLNVLAGCVAEDEWNGSIKINGRPRDMKKFRKISAYIMQQDLVQPYLTVGEQLTIVAKLKMGDYSANLEESKKAVNDVIVLLNLENCAKTMVEEISGGERKRLSMALDLIDKPLVVFIDEPTSGLDSYTVNLCIDALKSLANQGRTVVCTVHQPSPYMMQQFDQIYILSDGLCVYNGSTSNMLPFLTSLHLECPITYGYCEYIIEIVDTNPSVTLELSKAIQNGEIDLSTKRDLTVSQSSLNRKNWRRAKCELSFFTQFATLFRRMMTQQMRNKTGLCVQAIHHITSGILFGALFMNIGTRAKFAVFNFYFCLVLAICFVYTYFMKHVILFPFELELTRREYRNRWYGLKPYYLATSIRNLPIMALLGFILVSIAYLMTSQPLEMERFFKLILAVNLIAMTSEGMGLLIGCIFNTFVGSVVGPMLAAPLILLCLYGMGLGVTIPVTMKWLTKISFVRFGVIASVYSLLENRPPLQCPEEEICLYKNYEELLTNFGLAEHSYREQMLGLFAYYLLFKILAYFMLRYRLNSNVSSNKLEQMILKILGIKQYKL